MTTMAHQSVCPASFRMMFVLQDSDSTPHGAMLAVGRMGPRFRVEEFCRSMASSRKASDFGEGTPRCHLQGGRTRADH